jgi:C_GCAxxG_C_C family probable redox protein
MSIRTDHAVALFKGGYNCSQAVVGAFCADLGLDEKTAMRVSCGLGGGMGRLREVCGAVSGMAVLAGLKYGSDDPKNADAKKKTYEVVQLMANAFREKNGSIVCRQLLGLEKPENDPTPSERTPAYYQKCPCADYVADAADIVERTLFGDHS